MNIWQAIRDGNSEEVGDILDDGFDIETEMFPWTPLFLAIDIQNIPMIRYLIDRGANVTRLHFGYSAIHWAISRRAYSVIYLLIDYADINQWCYNGETPLTLAIKMGDVENVKMVCTGCPDLDHPNGINETPIQLANMMKDSSILEVLAEYAGTIPSPRITITPSGRLSEPDRYRHSGSRLGARSNPSVENPKRSPEGSPKGSPKGSPRGSGKRKWWCLRKSRSTEILNPRDNFSK